MQVNLHILFDAVLRFTTLSVSAIECQLVDGNIMLSNSILRVKLKHTQGVFFRGHPPPPPPGYGLAYVIYYSCH